MSVVSLIDAVAGTLATVDEAEGGEGGGGDDDGEGGGASGGRAPVDEDRGELHPHFVFIDIFTSTQHRESLLPGFPSPLLRF